MATNRKLRQPPAILKTMFYTEGNPAASIVTNKGGLRSESVMEFPQAEAALEWCREHGCTLVYTPFDPFNN